MTRFNTEQHVSTKDKVGKEPFGDMSDTDCYGLRSNTERLGLIRK